MRVHTWPTVKTKSGAELRGMDPLPNHLGGAGQTGPDAADSSPGQAYPRSDTLSICETISVTRTPKFSSMTTTSPLAMSL